jgi:nitrate reductase gamma subunit
MDAWLTFARGPFFRFTFSVMVLGLLRHVIVTVYGVVHAYRLTQHRKIAWSRMAEQTADWIVPLRHLRQRPFYTALSIVFHVGVIVTPLFLFGHIRLIESSTGISWPALPTDVANWLTLTTLAALFVLVAARLAGSASRPLSRGQDYVLPLILAVPFLTGYLIANPGINPLPHNPTLLVHMLSAGVCFLIIPFTKLAHMALQPLTRLPADLAWRFPDDYPESVVRQIGNEGQPI